MNVLKGLEPGKVFEFFEYISSVPRGSGNTGKVADLCVDFAVKRDLKYYRDELNNVIIYKNASEGFENRPTIILQGHLDMVCSKTDNCTKDMENEPIDLAHDDKYVYAIDTTLGGDDGIAVAMALAVLDSDEIKHPAIEAVFTIDEETGMEGAAKIDSSKINGRILLNIDSEEEGVFTCGCAGGCRINGKVKVDRIPQSSDKCILKVDLSGLKGGHSGADIDKQPASANELMGRVLFELNDKVNFNLISLNGGEFDNVITYSCSAEISVPADKKEQAEDYVKAYEEELKLQYGATNPELCISVYEVENSSEMLDDASTLKVLRILYLSFQGVIEMNMDLKGMVQTSQNIGVTDLSKDEFTITFLVRSSIDRQKETAIRRITEFIKLMGGKVSYTGNYPGWKYLADSPLREICRKVYVGQYGKEPVITTIHAGLECGLFVAKLQGLDAISIGPDILNIHTPMEKLDIASVERTWKLLLGILEEI